METPSYIGKEETAEVLFNTDWEDFDIKDEYILQIFIQPTTEELEEAKVILKKMIKEETESLDEEETNDFLKSINKSLIFLDEVIIASKIVNPKNNEVFSTEKIKSVIEKVNTLTEWAISNDLDYNTVNTISEIRNIILKTTYPK